jgi:hypothetical protein
MNKPKYKIGQTLAIINSDNPKNNQLVGEVIHIRPSVTDPDKWSYFLDHKKAISHFDQNNCSNWWEENLIPAVSIPLNSEYTAIVSEKEIRVGCQTFPIEILDKLVKAHQNL